MTFLTDFLDFIHGNLDLLFANGVMASGIVIGSVFLASDQLISAEQLPVRASSNLIWKNGLFGEGGKYAILHSCDIPELTNPVKYANRKRDFVIVEKKPIPLFSLSHSNSSKLVILVKMRIAFILAPGLPRAILNAFLNVVCNWDKLNQSVRIGRIDPINRK